MVQNSTGDTGPEDSHGHWGLPWRSEERWHPPGHESGSPSGEGADSAPGSWEGWSRSPNTRELAQQERGLAIRSRAQGCPKDCGTKRTCCACRDCTSAEAKVTVFAYLTPCFNDCGPYGQCSLLRRHGYLYAGCSCKAGECLLLGSSAILPEGTTQFRVLVFGWGSLGSAMAGSVTVPGEGKFWEAQGSPRVMENWDEGSWESPRAWRSASEYPQRDQGA